MITRAEVVWEARTWMNVPFHHQGRDRSGVDCGGLIGAVAVALNAVQSDWWDTKFNPAFGGYSRRPSNGLLERVCRSFMTEISPLNVMDGDIVAMRFKTEPQHLAIVVPYAHGGLAVIHALRSAQKVVEHRLDNVWRDRVVLAFRLPGVI